MALSSCLASRFRRARAKDARVSTRARTQAPDQAEVVGTVAATPVVRTEAFCPRAISS